MPTGSVNWFETVKGYGFVRSEAFSFSESLAPPPPPSSTRVPSTTPEFLDRNDTDAGITLSQLLFPSANPDVGFIDVLSFRDDPGQPAETATGGRGQVFMVWELADAIVSGPTPPPPPFAGPSDFVTPSGATTDTTSDFLLV